MPRKRDAASALSPALLRFLAVGDTAGSSAEDGHLDAFLLSGRVAAYLFAGRREWQTAIAPGRELYAAHRDEIESAARVATSGRYVSYAQAILVAADKIERAALGD